MKKLKMKIKNNKIIECYENELYKRYLEQQMDDVMDFNNYKNNMMDHGVKIIEDEIEDKIEVPYDNSISNRRFEIAKELRRKYNE
jgi:hypothetical protein